MTHNAIDDLYEKGFTRTHKEIIEKILSFLSECGYEEDELVYTDNQFQFSLDFKTFSQYDFSIIIDKNLSDDLCYSKVNDLLEEYYSFIQE